MKSSFSLQARLNSFRYAFRGIAAFLRREHNAWIHLLATIVVAGMGFYFRLSYLEWVAICLVLGLVWITEMLNTCVEKIIDEVTDERRPSIAFIKDVAAGAVLTAALLAVIVGLLVFGNKILEQCFS